MSIDSEHRVDGLPATDAFAAPGEPWSTLAALDVARLKLRVRDVTVRWALAGIQHRACATTWGMDAEAAEWFQKADALSHELADLQARLARGIPRRGARVRAVRRRLSSPRARLASAHAPEQTAQTAPLRLPGA